MESILITGGSGLIGKYLQKVLLQKGYAVSNLSSNPSTKNFYWNIETGEIDIEALKNADHIIHLAGANIGAKRWTERQKRLIIESRTQSAQLLFDTITKLNKRPKTFISASAVGYYGAITSEHIFTETDEPANDFLGNVCEQWEKSADRIEELGIRVVKLRTGVVLTPHNGVLEKIRRPIKYGFGSSFGNGKQYFPWIHINDLCEMYYKAIADKTFSGAYNAVAPQHCSNKLFVKNLALMSGKSVLLPSIPSFIFRVAFGEMSDLLLKGSRISSQKIEDKGFQYQFPTLESALTDLLK